MQIHELNNFTGTLGSGAYLAVDDGNDTGKLSTQQLLSATEARIDNIIAGPAPSAEEIVDARLGADGVTYPSLGDAIRDQVSDLKNNLRLTDETARIVMKTGKFWYKNNSNKLALSSYAQTNALEKIATQKGDKFRLRTSGTGTAMSYYVTDINNNVLSNGSASAFDGILEITDDDAAYLAVNSYVGYSPSVICSLITYPYTVLDGKIDGNKEVLWEEDYKKAVCRGICVTVPLPIENSAIYDTTGYYATSTSVNQMATKEYIRLHKNLSYSVITTKPNLMFTLYFYDEDYNFIEAIYPNNAMKYYKISFDNTDYSYMRIGAYLANIAIDDFKLFNIFGYKTTKKISCLGDSITAGVGTKMAFHMYLSHRYGYKCLNYGVGGTGFVGTVSGSNMQGDGVEGIGSMVTSSGGNNILNRVTDIPTDSDMVIVFGGTNDWGGNQNMTTFENNVNAVIDYFQTNIPTAELLFLTPVRRYRNGTSGEDENTLGYKLSDYCNKIKEACANKGVKCIDLYNNSGINPLNSGNKTALAPDGLHPSEKGHILLYDRIKFSCDLV